ncbi:hypothetical protein RvY_09233 [Ramazzottius varieornatus]|uniref:Uncharacterized protein n=1 Tax=Ramazzottius varieornatus TaxID=947166 RepID=A0A1D1VAW2_RAMVA|nr:hypothetical protein RvY_09233 [Ramazzottius varieornatus]
MGEIVDLRLSLCFVAAVFRFVSTGEAMWVSFDRFADLSISSAQLGGSGGFAEWNVLKAEVMKMENSVAESAHLISRRAKKKGDPESNTLDSSVPGGRIECPSSGDALMRAVCPTVDRRGRYRCIDASMLCNAQKECPNGEDEDLTMCMFYKLTVHYVGKYGQTITRWVLPA